MLKYLTRCPHLEVVGKCSKEGFRGEEVLHHADKHAALTIGDPVKVVLGKCQELSGKYAFCSDL